MIHVATDVITHLMTVNIDYFIVFVLSLLYKSVNAIWLNIVPKLCLGDLGGIFVYLSVPILVLSQ